MIRRPRRSTARPHIDRPTGRPAMPSAAPRRFREAPTSASKRRFLEKLRAFQLAASDLDRAWADLSREDPRGAKTLWWYAYPFERSFDEIANDIGNWYDAASRQG